MTASIRFGVLTASDRSHRGERSDESGAVLRKYIADQGWLVERSAVLPDDEPALSEQLAAWCDEASVDVIVTTGGTGFAPRDVTPEATLRVIDREAPGIAEMIRNQGLRKTPHAALSRGRAGIRKDVLIVNLPGSPSGALDGIDAVANILVHAVMLLRNDSRAEAGHKKV